MFGRFQQLISPIMNRENGFLRGQWYSSGSTDPTSLTHFYRNVLVMINYQPSLEAIQTQARTNAIEVAIRDFPFGNSWLNLRVIFNVVEMIGPERLLLTHLSDIHETSTDKIHSMRRIYTLPDTFFTFRLKNDRNQTEDLTLTDTFYNILELHRPHWSGQQHQSGRRTSSFAVR